MNREQITELVQSLNDHDLTRLIAIANYEDRYRLGEAHRAIVLKNGYCPIADHYECHRQIARQ